MMKTPLYEALSDCLDAIESGMDIETCLARYPHLAADLRPLLVTAAQARAASVNDIPEDVMRRSRARVLNAAAELRERAAAPVVAPRLRWPKFHWSARLSRLVMVTLIVLAFMVTGGAGLASASNGALPGDQLYPIKRRLEDLRLLLAFDPLARQVLEEAFENERMEEIGELFSRGRETKVDFYGYLTARTETGWIINQVIVQVTPQTRLEGALGLGAYVEVEGYTSPEGIVIAERIRVRKGGEGEEKEEKEEGEHQSGVSSSSMSSASGSSSSAASMPTPLTGKTSEPTRAPESTRFEFEGVIQSMDGDTWRISGQTIRVTGAELEGQPRIGALVRLKGNIIDGVWVAREIKVRASSGGSSASSSGGASSSSASGGELGGSGSSSNSGTSSSSSSDDDDDDHESSSSSSSSKSDDD